MGQEIRNLRVYEMYKDGELVMSGTKFDLASQLFVVPKTITNKKRICGYEKKVTNKYIPTLREVNRDEK